MESKVKSDNSKSDIRRKPAGNCGKSAARPLISNQPATPRTGRASKVGEGGTPVFAPEAPRAPLPPRLIWSAGTFDAEKNFEGMMGLGVGQ